MVHHHSSPFGSMLLVDKYTQADSSKISLVQVDLEQIKYVFLEAILGVIWDDFLDDNWDVNWDANWDVICDDNCDANWDINWDVNYHPK